MATAEGTTKRVGWWAAWGLGLLLSAALLPLAVNEWKQLARDRVRAERAAAHVAAGERALEGGDVERALVAFREARALEPNDRRIAAQFLEAKARALVAARIAFNRDGALGFAHRVALALESGREPRGLFLTARGVLARMLEGASAARGWFQRALELDGKDAQALLQLGRLELSEGHVDDAVALLRKAIEADGSNGLAHQVLGLALLRKGRNEEAAQALQKARDNDPRFTRDTDTLLALGQALLGTGDDKGAAEALSQVVAIDPNRAEAYEGLGLATFRLGRYDEAIRAFTESFQRTRNISSYFNLGVLYQTVGDHRRAATIFNEVIANAPRFAQAYYRLAVSLIAGGQLEQGAQVADRYFAMVEDTPSEQERVADLKQLLERAQAAAATRSATPQGPEPKPEAEGR